MSFFSFVKVAISTVAKAAKTVTSVCQAIEPVVQALPSSAKALTINEESAVTESDGKECINVGLVRFENANALITESLNLKRLETFLTFLGSQEPKSDIQGEINANQTIWLHNVTTLLAEVAYQQQILLTTKPLDDFDTGPATNTFNSFSKIYGGYANDLAITVANLGIIAVFQRAGKQEEYTSQILGRTDTWEFSGISIEDDHIQKFIKNWDLYFKSTTKGSFGNAVKGLAK